MHDKIKLDPVSVEGYKRLRIEAQIMRDQDDDRIRSCDSSCSHFDSLNQCCWIVTNYGLCSDVHEGDTCLYGHTEG